MAWRRRRRLRSRPPGAVTALFSFRPFFRLSPSRIGSFVGQSGGPGCERLLNANGGMTLQRRRPKWTAFLRMARGRIPPSPSILPILRRWEHGYPGVMASLALPSCRKGFDDNGDYVHRQRCVVCRPYCCDHQILLASH